MSTDHEPHGDYIDGATVRIGGIEELASAAAASASSGIEELASAAAASASSASTKQLARALWAVGFLTLTMDVSTALYKPARGVVFGGRGRLAYYLTLAGILAAGVAEVSTAFWVSGTSQTAHGQRRRAFGRAVLYTSIVPLVAIMAIGGFSIVSKT